MTSRRTLGGFDYQPKCLARSRPSPADIKLSNTDPNMSDQQRTVAVLLDMRDADGERGVSLAQAWEHSTATLIS